VVGNYAYVADGSSGLRVISVSDPAHPQEVGYYNTPGSADGVAVVGNYAYVADRGAGLRVIDVSNPAQPQEAGYYDTPGSAWGVAVTGSLAYVADWGAGLQIVEFLGAGVEEGKPLNADRLPLTATVVRGVLVLGGVGSRQNTADRVAPSDGGRCGQLLDAAGRKVMALRAGANDVSALAPGVYFVRAVGRKLSAVSCHKVLIQR